MERKKHICNTLFPLICKISILLFTVCSTDPEITGCEVLEHANITCYWTAHSSENATYMMQVTTHNCMNNKISVTSCNTTSTQCSVKIDSLAHCFCVDVLVFISSITTSVPNYCFEGIEQVRLNTPQITLASLPQNGRCLKLEWKDPRSQYVPSEWNKRVLEIEYHSQQAYFPKVNAPLHAWQTYLCDLYPGTKHWVRVRAQDIRAMSHWSLWSGFAEATTVEAAPVATPELWRHIQPEDRSRQRRITLLWKALQWPHTNGVIIGYAASCRDEEDLSFWDCGHLDSYSNSCMLSVSAHACNCNLTASNSAGTSPSAHIYIPGAKDTELEPPESISVSALDDFRLKAEWTATVNQSESRFVVEWFPIPDTTANGLYWKILNGSETSFNITEGVYPEVPYNVSVRVLHKYAIGAAKFAIAFTRQGAPSAGPKLEVVQTTRNDVTLKWQPVPLETLRGFIQNYTVLYKYNGKMKYQVLSGVAEHFSLNGLSPGEYSMCVKAHTLAGGAESSWITVGVGSVQIPVTAIVLCTIGTFILVIFLSQAERIHQCLCPNVPDPSKSSLSTWTPVSPHQHKLPVVDFKPSPPLFEPVCMGGGIRACLGHQHHHNDKQTHKQIYKQVLRAAKQTISEPDGEHSIKELTTDLSYQNAVLETPHWCDYVSSSCPEIPNLGIAAVDSVFCKSNIVPILDSGYEKLEACSDTHASSDRPRLTVDTMDPEDLVCRRSTGSKLKTYCYTHVSTSYLPVADYYIDVRTEADVSTNLIHKSNHFSITESGCNSHVSAGYRPVPEPSLAYADFIAANTADFLHHMPKKKANAYTRVSKSYLSLPLTHSEAGFTNDDHENHSGSGLTS